LFAKKTATCVALCDASPGDKPEFDNLISQARKLYNDRLSELRKRWGTRVLGMKTRHKIQKRISLRQEEAQKRKKAQAKKDEENAAAAKKSKKQKS